MSLSPEREKEIANIRKHAFAGPYAEHWNNERILLEEIDRLRAENDQLSKNYQEQHHDFAVMCGHYREVLKERDQLADYYKVALDQYKKLSEKNKVLEAENEALSHNLKESRYQTLKYHARNEKLRASLKLNCGFEDKTIDRIEARESPYEDDEAAK